MLVGCVVLAAGSSRRFGGKKLHASLAGESFIEHSLSLLPQDGPALVVTGDPLISALAQKNNIAVVNNASPELGISRSIFLGTQALSHCDGICFLVADQPLLQKASVLRLIAHWRTHPNHIMRAAHNGVPANPCVFPKVFFPALRALQGDQGGSTVAKAHPDRVILLELPARELFDCDTPEALHLLQEKEGLL